MNDTLSIAGAIVPAAVAGLIVYFLSSMQHIRYLRSSEKHHHDSLAAQAEIRRWEKRSEIEEKYLLFLSKKLERAHVICSSLSRFISQTNSFITSECKMSLEEWDRSYIEETKKYEELMMIVGLYFQDMTDVCSSLYGEANCFWMNHRHYLWFGELGKNDLRDSYSDKIAKASMDSYGKVQTLENGLARHAREIAERRQRIAI